MASSRRLGRPPKQKFLKGYQPERFGHGNFPTMIEAIASCMNLASLYYDRGFGISDCTIEPFEGMVSDL